MNTRNLCRNTVAIATVLLIIFTAAAPAINVAADRNTYEQTQNTESENPLSLSPEMISDALGGLGINDLLGQLGLGDFLSDDLTLDSVLDGLLEKIGMGGFKERFMDILGSPDSKFGGEEETVLHWDEIDIAGNLCAKNVDVTLYHTDEDVYDGAKITVGSVAFEASGFDAFSVRDISVYYSMIDGSNAFSIGSITAMGAVIPVNLAFSKTVTPECITYNAEVGDFSLVYDFYPAADKKDKIHAVIGDTTLIYQNKTYTLTGLTFDLPGKTLACDMKVVSAVDPDGKDATELINGLLTPEITTPVEFGVPDLGFLSVQNGTLTISSNTASTFTIQMHADSISNLLVSVTGVEQTFTYDNTWAESPPLSSEFKADKVSSSVFEAEKIILSSYSYQEGYLLSGFSVESYKAELFDYTITCPVSTNDEKAIYSIFYIHFQGTQSITTYQPFVVKEGETVIYTGPTVNVEAISSVGFLSHKDIIDFGNGKGAVFEIQANEEYSSFWATYSEKDTTYATVFINSPDGEYVAVGYGFGTMPGIAGGTDHVTIIGMEFYDRIPCAVDIYYSDGNINLDLNYDFRSKTVNLSIDADQFYYGTLIALGVSFDAYFFPGSSGDTMEACLSVESIAKSGDPNFFVDDLSIGGTFSNGKSEYYVSVDNAYNNGKNIAKQFEVSFSDSGVASEGYADIDFSDGFDIGGITITGTAKAGISTPTLVGLEFTGKMTGSFSANSSQVDFKITETSFDSDLSFTAHFGYAPGTGMTQEINVTKLKYSGLEIDNLVYPDNGKLTIGTFKAGDLTAGGQNDKRITLEYTAEGKYKVTFDQVTCSTPDMTFSDLSTVLGSYTVNASSAKFGADNHTSIRFEKPVFDFSQHIQITQESASAGVRDAKDGKCYQIDITNSSILLDQTLDPKTGDVDYTFACSFDTAKDANQEGAPVKVNMGKTSVTLRFDDNGEYSLTTEIVAGSTASIKGIHYADDDRKTVDLTVSDSNIDLTIGYVEVANNQVTGIHYVDRPSASSNYLEIAHIYYKRGQNVYEFGAESAPAVRITNVNSSESNHAIMVVLKSADLVSLLSGAETKIWGEPYGAVLNMTTGEIPNILVSNISVGHLGDGDCIGITDLYYEINVGWSAGQLFYMDNGCGLSVRLFDPEMAITSPTKVTLTAETGRIENNGHVVELTDIIVDFGADSVSFSIGGATADDGTVLVSELQVSLTESLIGGDVDFHFKTLNLKLDTVIHHIAIKADLVGTDSAFTQDSYMTLNGGIFKQELKFNYYKSPSDGANYVLSCGEISYEGHGVKFSLKDYETKVSQKDIGFSGLSVPVIYKEKYKLSVGYGSVSDTVSRYEFTVDYAVDLSLADILKPSFRMDAESVLKENESTTSSAVLFSLDVDNLHLDISDITLKQDKALIQMDRGGSSVEINAKNNTVKVDMSSSLACIVANLNTTISVTEKGKTEPSVTGSITGQATVSPMVYDQGYAASFELKDLSFKLSQGTASVIDSSVAVSGGRIAYNIENDAALMSFDSATVASASKEIPQGKVSMVMRDAALQFDNGEVTGRMNAKITFGDDAYSIELNKCHFDHLDTHAESITVVQGNDNITFVSPVAIDHGFTAASMTGTVGGKSVDHISYANGDMSYLLGTVYFSPTEGLVTFTSGQTPVAPEGESVTLSVRGFTVSVSDGRSVAAFKDVPMGDTITFPAYQNITCMGETYTSKTYLVVQDAQVSPAATVKDVVNDEGVGEVPGSGFIIDTSSLDALKCSSVKITNGDKLTMEISVDALKKICADKGQVCITYGNDDPHGHSDLVDATATMAASDRAKVFAGIFVNVNVEGSDQTSDLGTVTISVPTDGTYDVSKMVCYYFDGEKLVRQSGATLVDGKIVFTTNHFSGFVLCEKLSTDHSDPGTTSIAIVVVGVIAIVLAIVLFLLYRTGMFGKKPASEEE